MCISIKYFKKIPSKYNVDIKAQKVQHLEAILYYLQQEPRVLLGCNNLSLCARLKKTRAKNPFYAAVVPIDFTKDDAELNKKTGGDGVSLCWMP